MALQCNSFLHLYYESGSSRSIQDFNLISIPHPHSRLSSSPVFNKLPGFSGNTSQNKLVPTPTSMNTDSSGVSFPTVQIQNEFKSNKTEFYC